jgi:hypothetical protein
LRPRRAAELQLSWLSFAIHRGLNWKNCANHRKELRNKSVSENDAIFCIFNFFEIGDAKKDIVFAYRQDSRPAAASGKLN